MLGGDAEQQEEFELEPLHRPGKMEDEDSDHLDDNAVLHDEDPLASEYTSNTALDRRTLRKLDFLLLPFLALLFLLNALDKSNIGNAETAGYTHDTGLAPKDLNISMSFFFGFFVALQPFAAALGRKIGMVRFVPTCMSLWGVCTLLHIWVRRRWHLILLRIAIAVLEAGFYSTAVTYLSLFYTRYEFAVRLGFVYGQLAVAGALGGVLSWAVYSHVKNDPTEPGAADVGGWKKWEALFMVEGCTTIVVALSGFFWLPKSAETAWFFNAREKIWAERRLQLDHDEAANRNSTRRSTRRESRVSGDEEANPAEGISSVRQDQDESHDRLLSNGEEEVIHDLKSATSARSITADAGLSRQDILSAVLNYKIWHILTINILSAIPATSFGIFLPLVIKQLSPSLDLSPAASNLLSAPPFAFGALILFIFTRWSDRSRKRFVPILVGLGILIVGLMATVLIPMDRYVLRYFSICLLLSGSFIASPLTVTWLTNNTPEPGKRAILVGINGLGTISGVFLSVLFTPKDRENGYIRPFVILLLCAIASFAGYVALYLLLIHENKMRDIITSNWSEAERDREERFGNVPIRPTFSSQLQKRIGIGALLRRMGNDESRRGDEKMTFRYGL